MIHSNLEHFCPGSIVHLLFLLLCNDDIVGENKEVEWLLCDLSLSKELLFDLQKSQCSSSLQLSAHGDQRERLQLTKVELFVDLMKLLSTLHFAGTIVASRHKLERERERERDGRLFLKDENIQ